MAETMGIPVAGDLGLPDEHLSGMNYFHIMDPLDELRELVQKRGKARWFWLVALSAALDTPEDLDKWFAIKGC